ncbi:hypothetical protein CBW65_04370 [Tumebacillus avium]|uniref:Aminotransferase class III n=1 Tax=Tumebacillus avium TaxID=1903704 RepID=A0A1Y0ILJ4_9BACL|nr:aminotransferase class III-fold pyridoxal phosphate-dependent enzyme [Tumebacillus avium]ARU60385.1 hypothetical protein CBW65_04370 [Tumebacillus avium]
MTSKSEKFLEYGAQYTGTMRKDLDSLYPVLFEKGKGAYVWDMEGNKYLDFTGATGAIILGYCYDEVDKAVAEYLSENGNVFITKFSKPRVELARKLVEHVPCAEHVSFHKTGSCATTVAMRLAKTHTNREIVLTCGYHGWHDWQLSMFPDFRIPDEHHLNFEYSLDKLEELIEKHKDNVACVFITPEPSFFPMEYFHELREITKKHGILLIFDEVASGFRYELGGFQKFSGVIPDMATFSKGLANGYAISAVCGPKEIMVDGARKNHFWSTFDAEIGPMVAALKTIEVFEKQDALKQMWEVGQYFYDQLHDLFNEAGVVFEMMKYPTIFHIIFDDTELYDAWILESLKRGVVLSRYDYQLISYSHTKADIDFAIERVTEAFYALKERFPNSFYTGDKPNLSQKTLAERLEYEIGGTMEYRKGMKLQFVK